MNLQETEIPGSEQAGQVQFEIESKELYVPLYDQTGSMDRNVFRLLRRRHRARKRVGRQGINQTAEDTPW